MLGITKKSQLKKIAKKKPKLLTQKQVIKKLDKLIGDYVKSIETSCCTCGASMGSGGVSFAPGHFVTRGVHALRWDLRNVHTQCNGCNFRHEFDPLPYTRYMLSRYGAKIFDEFAEIRSNHTKFGIITLRGMLEEYREKFRVENIVKA